jgi:hypothetical protein
MRRPYLRLSCQFSCTCICPTYEWRRHRSIRDDRLTLLVLIFLVKSQVKSAPGHAPRSTARFAAPTPKLMTTSVRRIVQALSSASQNISIVSLCSLCGLSAVSQQPQHGGHVCHPTLDQLCFIVNNFSQCMPAYLSNSFIHSAYTLSLQSTSPLCKASRMYQ